MKESKAELLGVIASLGIGLICNKFMHCARLSQAFICLQQIVTPRHMSAIVTYSNEATFCRSALSFKSSGPAASARERDLCSNISAILPTEYLITC